MRYGETDRPRALAAERRGLEVRLPRPGDSIDLTAP